MSNYYFEGDSFVINNYNNQKTFANFLPGVAGKKGIPLWSFYVNRAQGLSGYGLQDKSKIIMEFTPANKAYETVGTIGFRTFIKVNDTLYEAFKEGSSHPHKMRVNKSSFTIEETNKDLGLKTTITYFGLPNEPIAGLVRKVDIENISSEPITFELLDGITEILPSGIHNDGFKSTSNLLASWMDVVHLDDHLGYYKLRASTNDTAEVQEKEDGNFYIGIVEGKAITPIVDQDLVFAHMSSKALPIHFMETDLKTLTKEKQVTANKIPCGFIPVEKTLKPKENLRLHALSGHADNYETLQNVLKDLKHNDTLEQKEVEAKTIIDEMVNDVATDTALKPFDEYIKQNYLDNFLRGGYPISIGQSIYHLYSRRHGDLERDYNYFSLAPEYYSQGAGNFRDVCQNRRMDTFINKDVERFNIHHFASLIQLDGYNPLSVKGTLYALDEDKINALSKEHFDGNEKISKRLKQPFTPGQIVNFVENNKINALTDEDTYLNALIKAATPSINAAFGEGFWSDHFTYVLDLVETYEAIYPDRMHALLYQDESFLYFESPVSVLKQHEKTVLTKDGKVRQYGSLLHFDEEKIKALNIDPNASNFTKINGNHYTSTLFVKLLSLVMNKHSLLDSEGLGIEMEADKPGWNDAMNGVPGLHGSGVSETIELLRIVAFLNKYPSSGAIRLPVEMKHFFESLNKTHDYQTRVKAREAYREAIRFGLSGAMESVNLATINAYLEDLSHYIKERLEFLVEENNHLPPTFLTYQVKDYEPVKKDDKAVIGHYGLPLLTPTRFERKNLPAFLEAPARLLKTDFDQDALKKMHQSIKASEIFDEPLKIYKTSECLNGENHEIGRIRAFTKGWLERESTFLHMTYKYLLGLIKAGLYEEFYEAIETNLVCFMNPEKYGRSTLENSSFIAPSNNPNEKIHGQGFFARLSGSTVETIDMWREMMSGEHPFKWENDTLILAFKPKLHKRFFKEDKTVRFKFLKDIEVTYINQGMDSTYDRCDIYKIELINEGGKVVIEGDKVTGKEALNVRQGKYDSIIIYMNK